MRYWGLGLAGFTILSLTGCETLQTVDKGLYLATEAVTETDRVTGRRALSLQDRARQIEVGNEAALAALARHPVINAEVDAEQYARAQAIFARIHAVSHLRGETWTVALVPDESFNAFVTGGTYVVVHQGLMTRLIGDDEVAAVLGHEMGHVAANHVFEQLTHTLAAKAARSSSVGSDAFEAAYDHEQEREADRIGILYMALAGYDPRAASRIWQAQFKEEGNLRVLPGGSARLLTHPVNSERAAEAAVIGDQVATYYTPGELNPDAPQLLEDNVLWTRATDDLASTGGRGGGALAALSTALDAYSEHQKTKYEARRQAHRAQMVQYVDSSSVILSQKLIDEATWEVSFQYRGALPLTQMVIAADLLLPDKGHIRIVREVTGKIGRGSTHVVRFSDERLRGVDKTHLKISYTVDDAGGPNF